MTKKSEPSYQQLSQRLDEIMTKIEDPNIDVDHAIELYQEGMELVEQIDQYLKKAETKIDKIKAKFSQA